VIFAGEAIRAFTSTLLVGLIAGTVSSLAVAAPLVYSRRLNEASASPPSTTAGTAALPKPV